MMISRTSYIVGDLFLTDGGGSVMLVHILFSARVSFISGGLVINVSGSPADNLMKILNLF